VPASRQADPAPSQRRLPWQPCRRRAPRPAAAPARPATPPRPTGGLGGHLHRQPRLAAPPGPRERDQPLNLDQFDETFKVRGTANEARQRDWQTAHSRRRWGSQPWVIRRDQLPHLLGPLDAPQHPPPPVQQAHASGNLVGHQPRGHPRQQRLAPVRQGPQPGGTVHRRAVPVAVTRLGVARVYPRAHPQRHRCRPLLGANRPLYRDRRRYRPGRMGEHREARIALSLAAPTCRRQQPPLD
jgi:hypothetical protein